jgi:exodeoxyribonuclease VII large subunit
MPADAPLLPAGVKVLSVSELTTGIKLLLEDAFPSLYVGGEVSNLSRPSSGHIYLTLKDSQAQLAGVVWRSAAARLRVQIKDGLEVVARGKLAVYPPHGKYQLVIEQIYPKGLGALELAYQQLKEKLFQRGWFAEERKKPLPRFPRCIGLVTSESGAAIRDMLRIIPRRWPAAEVLLCPVAVQGDAAAEQIATAIGLLNRLPCVDVMIVGRGGGSLEDLWAFNEEVVATAIFHSKIPVISAVGHEVDFTIADFVADRRAATPSEAAELVVPDHVEVRASLEARRRHATARILERLSAARKLVTKLAQQRVLRLPLERIRELEQRLDDLDRRGRRCVQVRLERWRGLADRQAARLQSLSPLNVLGRGYSLTRRLDAPELLRSTAQIQPGQRIVTRLAQGEMVSIVESVSKESPGDGQANR